MKEDKKVFWALIISFISIVLSLFALIKIPTEFSISFKMDDNTLEAVKSLNSTYETALKFQKTQEGFTCITQTYYNHYDQESQDWGCREKVTFADGVDHWKCYVKACNQCPTTPMLIDDLLQVTCEDEKSDGLGGEGSGCRTCAKREEITWQP